MTQSQSTLSDDIAYVRQMAEEGASAPSLGGRFYVWWGTLVSIAALVHWAIIAGHVPVRSMWALLVLWGAMAVVGVAGNIVLGRSMPAKPGGSSPGNRAESGLWLIAGAGFGVIWLGIIIAVVLRGQDALLFDAMFPVGFLVYAIAGAVQNVLMRKGGVWWQPLLSLGFAGVTMAFAGSVDIYLVAAIGVFACLAIPGFLSLRREPSMTV